VRRLPAIAAFVISALFLSMPPAVSGEKVDDELARLRAEVAALRVAVEKLAGKTPDAAELAGRLLDIARRLQAGEKLAEGGPDLALLREFLVSGPRMGGPDLNARALGLVQSLPVEQRAALFAAVLADVSLATPVRQSALRDLAGCGEAQLRPALLKAMEAERLLPPATTAAYWSDLRGELALAGFRIKEKAAVDFALDYLTAVTRGFEQNLRLKQEGMGEQYYGPSFYGTTADVLRRVAFWSGNAELQKLAPVGVRYAATASLKKPEEAAACLAELGKVREWWKTARENFDFPPEPVKAPEPVRVPVGPGAQPQPDPGKDPKRPEIF
jgi:hypothetical protein